MQMQASADVHSSSIHRRRSSSMSCIWLVWNVSKLWKEQEGKGHAVSEKKKKEYEGHKNRAKQGKAKGTRLIMTT